jgi:hypothetical protein
MLLLKATYSYDGTPSSIAFLKSIISESHVDTNATQRLLRAKLSSLDAYMTSVESDMVKLNQYVNNLLDSLVAKGAKTEDLLSSLFKGYSAASDKVFCAYIKKKEEDYDEGKEVKAPDLMVLAEKKFKAMVESGTWNTPDEQAEKIIALQAQVQKLAKANKSKTKGGEKGKGGNKETDPKKKKKKKDKNETPANKKPNWMMKALAVGAPKKKTVDGKEYHLCPNHNCWTRHSPSDCKGKGASPATASKDKSKSVDWDGKTKKPILKIAKALQTIADDNLEDDE